MARISNTTAYANINPVLTDYFVLTDKANNLATKTCTLQSLQTLFGLSDSQVSVSVPAASLHYLLTTPIELIASPGAGYVLQIKEILCFMDAGPTPFDFANGAVPKLGTVDFNTIPQATLNSVSDTVFNIGTKDNVTLPASTPLTLTSVANTATTNGNGTLYFNITYQTLKLASTF